MIRVLAIIVTYNAMPWLERCLGSVRRSGMDAIVIDNGSCDGTQNYIKKHFPEMKLFCSEKNLGFGAANNLGFQEAILGGYDYVYLLNQDAWLEENTLATILKFASSEYAVISPMQWNASDQLDPAFARILCKASFKVHESKGKQIIDVPFVMAAHWLISCKALLDIGGFSPAFKHYGEDDNWAQRARYFGYKMGVCPSAKAIHDRGNRKTSKTAKMNLKCVATLVKISNPNNCLFASKILEPFELVCMAIKNFSLIPLRFIPTLLRRYPELFALRKASQTHGAFL